MKAVASENSDGNPLSRDNGDAFSLNLEPEAQLRPAYRDCRRLFRKNFLENIIDVLKFEHVINENGQLDDVLEGRTRRVQKVAHILENLTSFRNKRALLMLPCFRIGGNHSGHKQKVADPDAGRMRQPAPLGDVELFVLGLNNLPCQRHVCVPDSGGCHHVELHLETTFNDNLPDHPCWRTCRQVLSINSVENIILQPAVNHRMNLDDPREIRAIFLKQYF